MLSKFLFLTLLLSPLTTNARTYPLSEDDLIGKEEFHAVKHEETLYDIARNYDLGVIELLAANPGVDLWIPGEHKQLILPLFHILPAAKRQGIVINLAELRLYYFSKDKVMSFPIGIGTEGFDTPVGSTFVTAKRKDPVWIPPDSIRAEHPELPKIVPAGPDNPLGQYALNLEWLRVVIHGTNKPWSIGTRSSHGCIRMYPEDIATLFKEVTIKTPVTVINQPVKVGRAGTRVYMEAHPTLAQSAALYDGKAMGEETEDTIEERIFLHIPFDKEGAEVIDWEKVAQALKERSGRPVLINQ